MKKNKLLILTILLTPACTSEKEERDRYIHDKLHERIQVFELEFTESCRIRAFNAADAIVDSTYKSNPLKFLNDSTSIIPMKPVPPIRPKFEKRNR